MTQNGVTSLKNACPLFAVIPLWNIIILEGNHSCWRSITLCKHKLLDHSFFPQSNYPRRTNYRNSIILYYYFSYFSHCFLHHLAVLSAILWENYFCCDKNKPISAIFDTSESHACTLGYSYHTIFYQSCSISTGNTVFSERGEYKYIKNTMGHGQRKFQNHFR